MVKEKELSSCNSCKFTDLKAMRENKQFCTYPGKVLFNDRNTCTVYKKVEKVVVLKFTDYKGFEKWFEGAGLPLVHKIDLVVGKVRYHSPLAVIESRRRK